MFLAIRRGSPQWRSWFQHYPGPCSKAASRPPYWQPKVRRYLRYQTNTDAPSYLRDESTQYTVPSTGHGHRRERLASALAGVIWEGATPGGSRVYQPRPSASVRTESTSLTESFPAFCCFIQSVQSAPDYLGNYYHVCVSTLSILSLQTHIPAWQASRLQICPPPLSQRSSPCSVRRLPRRGVSL
jgi:hypothetical protein